VIRKVEVTDERVIRRDKITKNTPTLTQAGPYTHNILKTSST
jgi:hypothetical protein